MPLVSGLIAETIGAVVALFKGTNFFVNGEVKKEPLPVANSNEEKVTIDTSRIASTEMETTILPHFESKQEDEGMIEVMIVNHHSTIRHNQFGTLKDKVSESTLMMGIGITSVTDENSYLESILNKGHYVRLLMIDPKVIKKHFRDINDTYNIVVKNQHVDEYFKRVNYCTLVQLSYDRVLQFIKARKSKEPRRGQIELKVVNSFIPMSLTSINEQAINKNPNVKDRELIAEFLLPFSEKRILLKLSEESDGEIYKSFISSVEGVWDNAKSVVKDF